MTLSVCIATRNRPDLLDAALQHLSQQSRLPEEIIVVDASSDPESERRVAHWQQQTPSLNIRWIQSDLASLPYQRRVAAEHSQSDIVLFIDDDIHLVPSAISQVIATYDLDETTRHVAGVGFRIVNSIGENQRRRTSWKELWLGTWNCGDGMVTQSGLATTHYNLTSGEIATVEWFQGGAMSFRRTVLQQVYPLLALERLYALGIGRAEDLVLCRQAAKYGSLRFIAAPLAIHRNDMDSLASRPYAKQGWKRGLTGTVGRAHTLKWSAKSRRHAVSGFLRISGLELMRCVTNTVRRPFSSASWLQAAGGIYGSLWTLAHWNQLSPSPAVLPRPLSLPGIREHA